MSIEFGAGPVGYQGDKDEKIREVVEKINKETEAAGLPWWAGMFNPEIVKLTNIEQGQCNCAKEASKRAETQEEKMDREMEAKRACMREADEKVIKALSWATKGLEKGAALLEGDVSKAEAMGVMDTMAGLCEAMSKMRSSMNGVSFYGYGA